MYYLLVKGTKYRKFYELHCKGTLIRHTKYMVVVNNKVSTNLNILN